MTYCVFTVTVAYDVVQGFFDWNSFSFSYLSSKAADLIYDSMVFLPRSRKILQIDIALRGLFIFPGEESIQHKTAAYVVENLTCWLINT